MAGCSSNRSPTAALPSLDALIPPRFRFLDWEPPGGGIRAAYWTVEGLDAITTVRCGRQMIFAISGASGDSAAKAVTMAAKNATLTPMNTSLSMEVRPAAGSADVASGAFHRFREHKSVRLTSRRVGTGRPERERRGPVAPRRPAPAEMRTRICPGAREAYPLGGARERRARKRVQNI